MTATTTPTTDERIAARRAELTKQRAERLDPLDYPRTWTQRQVNAYDAETATLDKEIAAFNTTVETWAALPTIDADTKWLAHQHAWRATISDERLAIKSPMRDKALIERAQRLEWSIKLIDLGFAAYSLPAPIISLASTRVGELMAAANYDVDGPGLRGPNGFRGSLPETEARIKTLTKQRTEAQAALDVALLTDDERATREADDQVFREVMKTMQCKADSTGTKLVAFTLDYDELPVSDMTEAQRKAFERFEAAHFGRPRETVTS